MGSEFRIMIACEWFIQRTPGNVLKAVLTAATVRVVFLEAVSQSAERRLAAE